MISFIFKHPISFLLAITLHILLLYIVANNLQLTKPVLHVLQLEDVLNFKHDLDTDGDEIKQSSKYTQNNAKNNKQVKPLNSSIVEANQVDSLIKRLKKQRKNEVTNALAQQKKIKAQTKALLDKQKKEIDKAKQQAVQIKKDKEELQKKIEKARQVAIQENKKAKQAEEKRLNNELLAKQQEKKIKSLQIKAQNAKSEADKIEEKQAILEAVAAERATELKRSRKEQIAKLKQTYIETIATHVKKSWRKPLQGSNKGDKCTVMVTQNNNGSIISVKIEKCNKGVSTIFSDSVEQATYRSDPLPKPESKEVFDRNIKFEFISDQ